VLRPSVPVDPLALPFRERFIRNATRIFVAFAAVALAISTLDLMNVSLIKAAGAYLHADQQRRMSQQLVSPSATTETRPTSLVQLASYNPDALSALEMTTASISPHAESVVRLPSPGERLHLTGTLLEKAERCLASAIYFEARAEPARGQSAVAQVIMNRVFSGHFASDICDVVYQNAHQRCQFSFACSGKRKAINERGAWARANRIAVRTLAGDLYDPAIGTSTHFHAAYLHPGWVNEMRKTVRYGTHTFYRPIAWGSGANNPVWGPTASAQNKASAR